MSDVDCSACPLHPGDAPGLARREFLRAAGLALASIGVLSASAAASPVRIVAAACREGDRGDEKRYPMPAADGVSFDKDNSVIIARSAGRVYAFSLACPHQNTALRWSAEDKEFQCPKHKSHYKADGTFIEGRATRGMDRLGIRRDGAFVVVSLDSFYQDDLNKAQWSTAFVAVDGSSPC